MAKKKQDGKGGDYVKMFYWATGSVLPQNNIDSVEGTKTILPCGRDPIDPKATILWTKGGQDVRSKNRFSVEGGSNLTIRDTERNDAGLYQCSSRTLSPSGAAITVAHNMYLNVQFIPVILNNEPSVTAFINSNAVLPCSAVGNPQVVYNWKYANGGTIKQGGHFTLSKNGSLIVRNVTQVDERDYICAPYNAIGPGQEATTYLTILIPPKFVSDIKFEHRVKAGTNATLNCVTSGKPQANVTWTKDGGFIDSPRVAYHPSGVATVVHVKTSDFGVYKCNVTSIAGSIDRSLKLVVVSLPDPPTKVKATTINDLAEVSWTPGYNGGSPQSYQVWYRPKHLTYANWTIYKRLLNQTSIKIPLEGENTHDDREINYFFTIRGKNSIGFGEYSDISEVRRSALKGVMHTGVNKGQTVSEKPTPPNEMLMNITDTGYVMSWDVDKYPGQPTGDRFAFEKRKVNSSAWTNVPDSASGNTRQHVYVPQEKEAKDPMEFRMFAMKGKYKSEPVYPTRIVKTGDPGGGAARVMPTSAPTVKGDDTDIVPAVVLSVIFGLFIIILLLSLYCFCRHKKRKKYSAHKNESKVEFKKKKNGYMEQEDSIDGMVFPSDMQSIPDSPRRFHLHSCPALKLGKTTNTNVPDDELALIPEEDRKYGVRALLEPNKDEKLLCTCGKNYLTLQTKAKLDKKGKKLYKSSSMPSVLYTSDDLASVSIDPSDLLDEEDYDISDVEKDNLGDLIEGKERSLNRMPYKDSFDQFCRNSEFGSKVDGLGSRKMLSPVKDEPEDDKEKSYEDPNDASSENSATESERITTPDKKHTLRSMESIQDGKSSGFGDGSNSTSDSESINQVSEPIVAPGIHGRRMNGYHSDQTKRDMGYSSDVSTRSSPLDYVSRHKYAPPNPYQDRQYRAPYNYLAEVDRPPMPNGPTSNRPMPPPYDTIDFEKISENDMTDSEEMYDNIMAMQAKLGVDLGDSVDSNLDVDDILGRPPMTNYSTSKGYMSDTGYMMGDVNRRGGKYSDQEKSQRCAQLLNEFKHSRNVLNDSPTDMPALNPAQRCQSVLDDVITEEPRLPPSIKRSNSTGASSVYREWLV